MHRKGLLKMTALLLASACPGAHMVAQVTTGHSVKQELRVNPESQSPADTLSVTQVQTVLPSGKHVDGSLISLYDPKTRLFWWTHEASVGPADLVAVKKEFLDTYKFSTLPDEITCFVAFGRTLWVRTSNMRMSSMEEGIEKAKTLLPEGIAKFESGGTMWFQEVPLSAAVGQTFFRPKEFGDPAVQLKIGVVDRSASGWRIEIKNDKGESKTVALSKDFKVAPGNAPLVK